MHLQLMAVAFCTLREVEVGAPAITHGSHPLGNRLMSL
jgi:hypothetical protein